MHAPKGRGSAALAKNKYDWLTSQGRVGNNPAQQLNGSGVSGSLPVCIFLFHDVNA